MAWSRSRRGHGGWSLALVLALGSMAGGCVEEDPAYVGEDDGESTAESTGVSSTSPTDASATMSADDTSTSAGETTAPAETSSADDTSTGDGCETEVCDGVDNDCDDEIDEDCECVVGGPDATCYTGERGTLGVGPCVAGTQSCQSDGTLGPCEDEVTPVAELCNGIDDDCDVGIDDGFGQVACGSGICIVVVQECVDTEPQPCIPADPDPMEACNGYDDDCDGELDEDCPCDPGDIAPCYTGPIDTEGVGVCTAGTHECIDGLWGPCVDSVAPQPEACDGDDDNCDGEVDDGFGGGTGESCPTGLPGVCNNGTEECIDGVTECVQTTFPSDESCDGLDNDCDTEVDEGNPGSGGACNTGLQGVCSAGTLQCQGGALQCVQSVQSMPESCDGLDNDCDGAVDEANPGGGGACNTGLQGVCAAGTDVCQGGDIVCVQNVQPSAEVCDAVDNDCDGTNNEGNPGSGAACNTGMPGVCAPGLTACQNDALVCLPNTPASGEVCDGLDNDCDAAIDDGNPGGGVACNSGQQGVCAAGTTTCQGGGIVCNANVLPSAEVCDAFDNDCDGVVNDGNPGGGAACNTGQQGVCGPGTTACTAGMIACNANSGPSADVCDGLDNDCDGSSDENNPGGGVGCSTGLPGVCSPGTTSCSGGIIVCNQTTASSAESCDGLDNDCDAQTDEGDPGGGGGCNTGAPGICGPGTFHCSGDELQCQPNAVAGIEICNDGLDNDCSGVVDNGCACAHQKCVTGVALASGCDPCVQQICATMPSCCTGSWTQACVDAVQTVCDCGNCVWGCAHNLCAEGFDLNPGCDPGCVDAICDEDGFCCGQMNGFWDSICVGEVASICGLACSC